MAITRYIRKTAVLAGMEATYGLDPALTGAANAMLVSNVNFTPLNSQNVDRGLLRNFFGASEQLIGTADQLISFDVEIAGSGVAGTPPAWGPLLRGCAFAQVITAGSRVEYTPITDAQESAAIYLADAQGSDGQGALHRLLGARGNVQFRLGLGDKPVMSYNFIGLYVPPTAAANPVPTYTAFKTPLVVTDANSGDITLGGAYANGVITGGTSYPSRGLEFNVGNQLDHAALLGDESVDVTDREVTGSFQLKLSAAQEVANLASVRANTLQSLSFQHGTVAGNIFLMYTPAIQLVSPTKQEQSGRRLGGYDFRALPVVGNDELMICMK
jgi:hypothetical protein